MIRCFQHSLLQFYRNDFIYALRPVITKHTRTIAQKYMCKQEVEDIWTVRTFCAMRRTRIIVFPTPTLRRETRGVFSCAFLCINFLC